MSTWLITGASSGIGAILADLALQAGHTVIATARDPIKAAQAYPAIEKQGGKWLKLDVTRPETQQEVTEVIKQHGGIDVLVNNAGYSILGAVEDMSEEEIHQQIDTNLYGPIRTIKAALPFMREKKSGTIVNVSSIAGLHARATCSLYSASKFALEGFSEALAEDLASFNIRVLLVEPGAFRTNFLGAAQFPAAGLNPAYRDTIVDKGLQAFRDADGKQIGDPAKAAQRIFEVVDGSGMAEGKAGLLRLPLGKDCLTRARTKIDGLLRNLEEMEEIALSTDCDQ
ncbi:hypothetical protein ASPZODRAFT_17314 [Penicilliopsis zonata CBS 506.65]|uniref:Uncharacterized protein n=1 Tax=Penicilliopsis zonata CBS 506.65 TaxID=1073090 RepID=A0A1L9SF90_9EURO|nr:hypothetical protein ASPZODRAFT_17314 [Penicilliopsis zonata CBS 506.65]OJJ45880.1 hypothetical protein ASPZODRAFT_17314 [Penicilliopsis zonata CBS 506.65]